MRKYFACFLIAFCCLLDTVPSLSADQDNWEQRTNMPTPRSCNAGVVNGRIYVIGGSPNDVNVFRIVEEYDPQTDKWTRKADMPTARSELSVSAVNGKIYAIGGWMPGWRGSTVVEEYNPATDKSNNARTDQVFRISFINELGDPPSATKSSASFSFVFNALIP